MFVGAFFAVGFSASDEDLTTDNPIGENPEPSETLTPYDHSFEDAFGVPSSDQTWNMASTQTIEVAVATESTITIYGNYTASIFGAKKLAVYSGVNGTRQLTFEKPLGLTFFFVTAANGQYVRGQMTDGTGTVTFEDAAVVFDLASCVTSETQNVEADNMIFNLLPESVNNTGKVTQSSLYVSDGQPFTVTPVYSNCGLTNTVGLYVQQQEGSLAETDLWTKTENHTGGIRQRPVFTITLPAGTVFGFYIRNSMGKYYSDATLNQSNAKSVGTIKSENCMYQAFEDLPLSGDFDFNDVVLRISPYITPLDTDASEWTVAVETGKDDDFDFNDVVFKVSYVKGDGYIIVTPLAAGTTDDVELYIGDDPVGEIHDLLNSQRGVPVNTVANNSKRYEANVISQGIRLTVSELYSLADNFGNLRVKVGGDFIEPHGKGYPTQILVIGSGTWRWPAEGVRIDEAYPGFLDWVNNPTQTGWIYE